MFKSTETFYQGFGQKLGAKPTPQIFDLKRIRNFNSNQIVILLPQRETIWKVPEKVISQRLVEWLLSVFVGDSADNNQI